MRKIDPTTIYETEELKDLLRGFVKVETLRQFGLIGSPGSGYWGQNVVDSINNYWDHLSRQRETGKVNPKEEHLDEKPEVFEKRNTKVQNGKIHAPSGSRIQMESEWERFERQLS